MVDREKVIKGLKYCFATANCDDCPYEIECRKISFKTPENHCPILDDVLNLLKEQEAIQVPEDKINKCECGETVCRYWHPKFCGFCGRKLLWY